MNQKAQYGLSLVELMVAIAVSLVLLAGASQLFLSTKQSYRITEGLSRLQENGRFVMDIMPRDLRQAGMLGCRSTQLFDDKITNNLGATNFSFEFATGVQGYRNTSGTWTPGLPTDIPAGTRGPASAVANTDMVVIRGAIGLGAQVTAEMANDNAAVQVSADHGFQTGDIVAVTDCNSASIFQISGIAGGDQLQHADPLGDAYGIESMVTEISTIVYYIHMNADNVPSLYRYIDGQPQELVPGVETMKVLYGVDTDNDDTANIYQAAGAVADWDQVVAVRMALLLRAPDDNKRVAESRSYQLLNTTVNPGSDRFQRHVYSTTILLRNRALPDV